MAYCYLLILHLWTPISIHRDIKSHWEYDTNLNKYICVTDWNGIMNIDSGFNLLNHKKTKIVEKMENWFQLCVTKTFNFLLWLFTDKISLMATPFVIVLIVPWKLMSIFAVFLFTVEFFMKVNCFSLTDPPFIIPLHAYAKKKIKL